MIQKVLQEWNNLSQLGIDASQTREEAFKISVVNKYLKFTLLSYLGLIVLDYFLSAPTLALATLPFLCLTMLAMYLCKKKQHQRAWHLSLISTSLIIVLTPVIVEASYNTILYLLNFLIVTLFLFEDKKIINLYFGITTITMIVFTSIIFKVDSIEAYSNPLLINTFILFSNVFLSFSIIQIYIKDRTKHIKEGEYLLSLNKAALNSTLNGILIINKQGKIGDYNERLISLWNVPNSLKNNHNATELFYFISEQLVDPQLLLRDSDLYADTNAHQVIFEELTLKNGRIFEYHSHPQIVNQQIVGRVINFRDISKPRKAQQLLEQSESRFKTIFEQSPIGIVLGRDHQLPMEHVNPKFCEMLGYTAEELKKLKVNDITYLKDRNIQDKPKESSIKGEVKNFSLRKRYIKKSGELLWANVHIAVIQEGSSEYQGDIVLVEDISEKITQEEKIEHLLQQLQEHNELLEEQVEKRTEALQKTNTELLRSNEDLEQFAYVASHDLQEPLRMVGNFVQLLEKQYHDTLDEEGKSYIQFAVDGVSRMSSLIHNLLKYSRVGKRNIAFRQTNIANILELKLYDLAQKIEETETKVILPDLPCELFCEPHQIGIVFYNLINNALKFNQKENKEIKVSWEERESDWRFCVADNGIGIEEQYKEKVFEIFKRLNRREDYEGTGIGLALCKKIITRHKGTIWFESNVGEGTTFYFTINKELQNELQLQSHSNSVG